MQPKFTRRSLVYFCTGIIALALILTASTQISAQQKPGSIDRQKPGYENTLNNFQKQQLQKAQQAAPAVIAAPNAKTDRPGRGTENDAGIPTRVSEQVNRPMGICTTFTGTLAAGDPTLGGGRMFRDGIPSTCAAPKAVCPGVFGGAGNWYDTYTFVNPSASAQCITIDFTNTSANTFAHFVSVHTGSFNPANVCTNYLADQGGSAAAGGTTQLSFTLPGAGTVVIAVTSVTVGTGGTYSMDVSAPVGCGAAPPCSWTADPVYPINVLDQANVQIGTDFYSFAGVSANAVIANSYRFNGTTWTAIAPTPQPLEYPAAVTDGTNAYILGGASTTGVSLTTLYRYNVATNTYTTLAPFTTGTWNPTAVYLAGKIYKFCGTGAAGSVNNLEIYDIATNTWTSGAPYPLAISFVSAIERGGFIYAGGGVQTTGTLASLKTYRYDPAANSWNDAAIADLPASRWGAAAGWYNNSFVMAGGYLGGAVTITNTATGWDQGTNTWTALPNMLAGRARMGGGTYGTAFHVIGGRSGVAPGTGFAGTNNNQRLFCIPPTPCTGTPAPGNTISSTNPVCSGVNFSLSLQNNPFVSGFTYQWQSAPASTGPWSNLSGGTNITYTGSQTGATWYRCIVTCTPSGLSGTSTPVLVADGQGIFTSQPANRSTQCSGSATFSYTATGASLTYAWEFRTTPTGFWYNAVPGHPLLFGAIVTGETTNALTLTGVPSNLNGYQFRGTIVGPCTAIDFSNPATLTVTPLIATVNVSSPVTVCTGTVTALTLTNASTTSSANFSSGPISIQIPDIIGPPPSPAAVCNAGINHTIPVALPPGAQVFRIDVTVNITHTYASDLLIVLKNSTTNQVLNLFYHKSAAQTAGANFVNTVISSAGTVRFSAVPPPFTGTFRADWELSPGFYGDVTGAGPTAFQPTTQSWNALWGGINQGSGNWTLAICDPQEWAGDIGTLTSWSMNITYGAPSQGTWTQTSPATPNSMFTDPGATIPYLGGLANTIYVKPLATAPFTGNSATYCVVYSTATPACTSPPTCVTVNVTSPITGLGTMADRQVCVGGTTSFSISPGGGPLSYQWSESRDNGLTWAVVNNGGVYSGATTNTLTLTGVTRTAPVDMNNFLYRCLVTAAPCGSQTTNNARLTVFGLPTVTITATDLALLPNQTSTITATSVPGPHATTPNWAWTRNGASYPGSTNSVISDIDRMGVFQATVTDINGCRNSSNQLLIEAETGDKLWLYPNPTSGQFQVRLFYAGVTSEKRRIQIFNSMGQEVMSQDILLSNVTSPRYQRFDINLTNQPSGVYLVKVTDLFLKKGKSGFVIKQSQ